MENKFKYIYGPVPSWRLGSSLGIDLLSQKDKICSFDCVYCQLGATKVFTETRHQYVSENNIIKELEGLPDGIPIDYITLSGRGEPTLAANLGSVIKSIRRNRTEPIAVITNSSLIHRVDVREELSHADLVIAKLDAPKQDIFEIINKPLETQLNTIVKGIKEFKKGFKGKLAIQIMFTDDNIGCAADIANTVKEIMPDEVQLNTPLRPCSIVPISEEKMLEAKTFFNGLNIISIYESHKKDVKPISDIDTLKRRGKE